MPNFTAPVGLQARNEIHDVALLQGALLILKNHKRLHFWDGPVDGDWRRHQQSLTEALKKLEAEAKINNGPGRIEANGPLARTLKQLLPSQYQSLSAIPGTACLTIKDPYGGQHKGPALKDLALHDQCRKDLERLIKAGADKLGLELVIEKEETDHKGRCVFTLKPHGVTCLDARMNPRAPGTPTPRPMIEAVAKQAASATTLDVPPHGSKLEVKTRQAQPGTSSTAKARQQPSGPIVGSATPPPTAVSWGIDWAFIAKHEGGRRLDVYDPFANGTSAQKEQSASGPTVATGVDIGQMDDNELRRLLGSEGVLYEKLRAYTKIKGPAAAKYLKAHPMQITDREAQRLDDLILSKKFGALWGKIDESVYEGLPRSLSLPRHIKTVLLSMAWNLGQDMMKKGFERNYNYPEHIANHDWWGLASELRTGVWSGNKNRRKDEGVYLIENGIATPTPHRRP